jgi:hypothetical protein
MPPLINTFPKAVIKMNSFKLVIFFTFYDPKHLNILQSVQLGINHNKERNNCKFSCVE